MTTGAEFHATAARLAEQYALDRDLAATQLKNSTDFIAAEGPFLFVPLHRVIMGLRGQDMLARNRSGQELARHHPALSAAGYAALREGAPGFDDAWEAYLASLGDLGLSGPSKGTPSARSVRVFYVPARNPAYEAVLRAMGKVVRDGIPEGFRAAKVWFVQHPRTGRFLPVKPVWGLATGQGPYDFGARQARDGLRSLGFHVPAPDDAAANLALTPAEFVARPGFTEGAVRQITTDRRERSPQARREAEVFYRARNGGRLRCEGCGIDFGRTYGPRGEGFMHFHHLNPLAAASGSREVDGARDLVPLCPNCHAMVHRGEDLLEIEDLRKLLVRTRA